MDTRPVVLTDLRHGIRDTLPLPAGVRCFAAAARLGPGGSAWKGRTLGDGLVPLRSALGQHGRPGLSLAFDLPCQWVGEDISHLQLLSRPEVFAQLLRWLR